MAGNNRKTKLRLMKESPFCFFCDMPLKNYDRIPDGERPPKDMATVEHILTKHERKKGECVEKVLACRMCNSKRGMEVNTRAQLSLKNNIMENKCFWFHNWDKWKVTGRGILKMGESVVGDYINQERICLDCGFIKINKQTQEL